MPTATRPRPFGIERWFAVYEFTLKHHLSCSDCETVPMSAVTDFMNDDAECAELWKELNLGYTESLGHPLLREEIRRKYRATARANGAAGAGDGFDVMTCVPLEGIVMTMQALLDADDVVIAMEPCYQVLSEIARARGCTVLTWKARHHPETGIFRFHEEDFCELFDGAVAAGRAPQMVVVNTPHNPTGHNLFGTPAAAGAGRLMDAVAARCATHDVTVFSDEMYAAILDDFTPQVEARVLHSNAGRPRTVCLSGLSKPQGLPGLRSGWLLVSCPEQFAAIAQQKDYMSICGVGPGEILSLTALRREADLVVSNQALVRANLAAFKAFCEEFGGRYLRTPCEEAPACTLFVALGPDALAKYTTSHAFTEALATQHGVGLLPGEVMWTEDDADADPSARVQAVRVGLGRKDFPAALDACRAAFNAMDQDGK